MKSIRIHKDVTIKVGLTTNKVPTPLEGRDLQAVLHDPFGIPHNLDFSVDKNVLIAKFLGSEHKMLGRYRVTVWENKEKLGQTATDFCQAFELVATTCEEDGNDPEGLDTETVDLSGDIAVGIQGPSNFDLAVSHGFTGTEEEYLASLHGEPFTYDDFTTEQIAELQKPATEAAVKCKKATDAAVKAVKDLPQKEVIKENVDDVTI